MLETLSALVALKSISRFKRFFFSSMQRSPRQVQTPITGPETGKPRYVRDKKDKKIRGNKTKPIKISFKNLKKLSPNS